jgi:hypothetical protein
LTADTRITQDTTWGYLSPPLGLQRLKVVELIAALMRGGHPLGSEAVMEAKLIPRCMQLLLDFPFNNLLHHQVCVCGGGWGGGQQCAGLAEASRCSQQRALSDVQT